LNRIIWRGYGKSGSQQNKNIPMAFTSGQAQHDGKPIKEGMAINPTLRSMQYA
jgi:hypothetical protein